MSEEQEIHPSHRPEPDDKRLFADFGYIVCVRCCYFVKLVSITPRGLKPCEPMKIGLRIEAMGIPVITPKTIRDHAHWAW